jgi:hypothetical protein
MATPTEQLECMRRLEENWDGYGAAAPQAAIVDLAGEFTRLIEAMLNISKTAWNQIHVSPTRIGGILIEWEDARTQHEIELNPDLSVGFLHLNKANGNTVTRKFVPGVRAVVDPGFLRELSELLAA